MINFPPHLCLLPPAYVVQREGNVFTGVCLSVCKQRRGHLWSQVPSPVAGARSFPGEVSKSWWGGGIPQHLVKELGVPPMRQPGLGTPPPLPASTRVPPWPGLRSPLPPPTLYQGQLTPWVVRLLRFPAGGLYCFYYLYVVKWHQGWIQF